MSNALRELREKSGDLLALVGKGEKDNLTIGDAQTIGQKVAKMPGGQRRKYLAMINALGGFYGGKSPKAKARLTKLRKAALAAYNRVKEKRKKKKSESLRRVTMLSKMPSPLRRVLKDTRRRESRQVLRERTQVLIEAELEQLEPWRRELVMKNLPLAGVVAKRFVSSGLPYDDAYQEAVLAMIRAAERFDPDKGYKWTTYATTSMANALKIMARREKKWHRWRGELEPIWKRRGIPLSRYSHIRDLDKEISDMKEAQKGVTRDVIEIARKWLQTKRAMDELSKQMAELSSRFSEADEQLLPIIKELKDQTLRVDNVVLKLKQRHVNPPPKYKIGFDRALEMLEEINEELAEKAKEYLEKTRKEPWTKEFISSESLYENVFVKFYKWLKGFASGMRDWLRGTRQKIDDLEDFVQEVIP